MEWKQGQVIPQDNLKLSGSKCCKSQEDGRVPQYLTSKEGGAAGVENEGQIWSGGRMWSEQAFRSRFWEEIIALLYHALSRDG